MYINILELKACQLCLKTFCKNITHIHIRIYMDNTTSCSYINNFGGKKPELDSLSQDIWFWCINQHIHLSAAHVAGIENCEASRESRAENDDTERSLDPTIFNKIHEIYPEMSEDPQQQISKVCIT